jgi:hypothetical protein
MKKNNLNLTQFIPPFKNNWNLRNKKNYEKDFTYPFINYYFPYLLKKMNQLQVPTEKMALLDIGCGWAPMAIPLLIYATAEENFDKEIKYLGIDIRSDAIEWLKKAYQNHSFIDFILHSANQNVDYIGAELVGHSSSTESDGSEGAFQVDKSYRHNMQWSSSLFTHLTPTAALEALKFIRNTCDDNSLQVNTWLIIDNESRYSLSAKIADRDLDIDCGSYLTYSVENPLVCTAYKISEMERVYRESGLEIVEIERGSWRGPSYRNSAMHYQDIVISRPLNV